LKRKQCIAIVGAVALRILCEKGVANADDWPVRPITMIVPFAAGSASDTVGRVMAAALTDPAHAGDRGDTPPATPRQGTRSQVASRSNN
jgi:tripartite-type tricarboxylate transporter receptor subunit TctC